jgi:very-short-patch-repair endonuclease
MHHATRFDPDIHGESELRGVDWVISELAERQHGVVTRRQLFDAGIARGAVEHRIGSRRLFVLYRGVYAVGHLQLTREGRWLGAVLAAGRGAVASHRMASALWGFWRSDRLEVTAPAYLARPGVQIHTSAVAGDETTTERGIPVTGVSRTILDLASVLRPHQVERAIHEVEVRRLTDSLSLHELVARYPRRRGIRTVKQILEAGAAPTRTELESRFLTFARKTRLPHPATNVLVLGFECDCVWHDQRVAVELDSRTFHDTSAAFERDRARDRALQAAGWRVIRVTWRQLRDDADALAADLRRILRAAPRRQRGRARGGGP